MKRGRSTTPGVQVRAVSSRRFGLPCCDPAMNDTALGLFAAVKLAAVLPYCWISARQLAWRYCVPAPRFLRIAGIGEEIGRAGQRGEQLADVRSADRLAIGSAEGDVADRRPHAVELIGAGRADRRIMRIPPGRADRQCLGERPVGQDRRVELAERLVHVERAARGRRDHVLVVLIEQPLGQVAVRREAAGLAPVLAADRELDRSAGQREELAEVAAQRGVDHLLGDPRGAGIVKLEEVEAALIGGGDAEGVDRHATAVRTRREGNAGHLHGGGIEVAATGRPPGRRIDDSVERGRDSGRSADR